jgi:SAM-dependent methyltransferase
MSLRPSGDMTPAQITAAVRSFYDAEVDHRDGLTKQDWKLDERAAFLDRLRAAEAVTLLEIGAGTGQDSVFFAGAGLTVVAVDLSPEMVARCRAKGIEAYERDFLRLGFEPGAFDAVYAMNCLVHVPNADLPAVLRAVRDVLAPGGLFYVGLWGGRPHEGTIEHDQHMPKRFFARRTDKEIFEYARECFEVLDFHTVEDDDRHFQALTLVRPVETP